MTPLAFRIAGSTELGLKLAELPGWFHDALPVGGDDAVQIACVLGAAYLLHDIVEMVGDAVQRIRDWWRRNAG